MIVMEYMLNVNYSNYFFSILIVRPLAEPVYDEKFLGEVQTSTAEYSDVFEERRQALTIKLAFRNQVMQEVC